MEDSKDDVILYERIYHQRSFLRKKVYLTVPICALLIVVFLSSAVIVSVVSYYWTGGTACYRIVDEQSTPEQTQATRPAHISRPKRSLPLKKTNIPCLEIGCCLTPLDPNAPWQQNRLPQNVYPIEYQLTLDLFSLNEENDQYSGTVDIIIEVQSPTYDIILHGTDILISDVTVSRRSNPDNIPMDVDCVLAYPETQTFTIHLTEQVVIGSVYEVHIQFFRALSIHGTGFFENQFNKDPFGLEKSRMLVTHFEPIHAREAFLCFDEPGFKAKFQLTVHHANNTRILSNWDESESFWDEQWIETEFQTTPPIPTALIAFTMFFIDDFDTKQVIVTHPATNRDIKVNLWARKTYFTNDNGIYIDAPLDMIRRIFTALFEIFRDIETPIVPNKIDILAVPDYPSDAISHWGLVIVSERAILHNPSTTSELEHQKIALLIAKELAEQWCGNLVSFQWWTDLWLQEAIANYVKYHAVNGAYPEWDIHNQFFVGELLSAMHDDSMSTSHPVIKSVNSPAQINELFDSIETTKATAILRMADYYMGKTMGIQNTTLRNIVSFLIDREFGFFIPDEFLNKYQIGSWKGTDFFDRWLLQSNFPSIYAFFIKNVPDNTYTFQLQQTRYLSAHMYDNDLYPPSTNPFLYIWYVPVTCYFGNDSTNFEITRTFLLDRQIMNASFGILYYQYFYCNTDFAGYYIMDYTLGNWEELSQALDNNNTQLTELDRANLLNNAFLDAQSADESYLVVREVTQFLLRNPYPGLLSWQTLSHHVNRMLDVLEYESLYDVVQKYFRVVVRNVYRTYESVLWNKDGSFTQQILKNMIIQLACRVQLHECINTVTALWDEAYPALVSGIADHPVVSHARDVVYRTHFQNTYNDSEWISIESDFHDFVDIQERHRLLEALTQSRQPWHLYQLLYQDAEANQDSDVDLLDILTLLAKNPAGRELVWLYYRENWNQLQMDYGRSNQRLGQLLIDITATFEDEFHELELIDFLVLTPGVENNVDARFWALERVNMNFWWIVDSSADMAIAFNLDP